MTDYRRAIIHQSTQRPAPRAAFSPFENRRAEVDRQDAMGISNHRISGFLTVLGAGEVAVDVPFPLWFVEKPAFSFGGELAEGHSAEALNMPTVSCVVLRWATQTREMATYWTGANLAVVTTGKEDHSMVVHWHMEGKAFVNPVAGDGGTDAAI
jgi:hypothetical protein